MKDLMIIIILNLVKQLSISFYMDYLGFFGYEQKSNLFFEETGDFNYGY